MREAQMPQERRSQDRVALIVMVIALLAILGWIWSALGRFD
jgi:hypothetical protein